MSAPITDLLVFDVESTGIDPLTDRIVTAFIGLFNRETQAFTKTCSLVIDSGTPIPAEATAVHGITDEFVRTHGILPIDALNLLSHVIQFEAIGNRAPLVVYNAPFDLTMLNVELERCGLQPFGFANPNTFTILDPFVIDKGLDKWRKGSRKLVDTARHYGVEVDPDKAHDAAYDCLLTAQIADRLLNGKARHNPVSALMADQVAWKAEQSSSLQAYFRSAKAGATQNLNAIVDGGWPLQSNYNHQGARA
jgi:DNA polymerase-3 subunit epsilon